MSYFILSKYVSLESPIFNTSDLEDKETFQEWKHEISMLEHNFQETQSMAIQLHTYEMSMLKYKK